LWAVQSSCGGGLALGACLGMKNIGKPCAGEPHARFDEGGQARACSLLYPPFAMVSGRRIAARTVFCAAGVVASLAARWLGPRPTRRVGSRSTPI
ncbi:MAG: hypothetical protein ACREYE_08380, partial [Gammaproteobacteria bacterium]